MLESKSWPVAAGGSSPAFTSALCRRPTASHVCGRWTKRERGVARAHSEHPNQKKKITPPTRPEPLSTHGIFSCVGKVHVPFLYPQKNRGRLHSRTLAQKLTPTRVGSAFMSLSRSRASFEKVSPVRSHAKLPSRPVAGPLLKPVSLRGKPNKPK